MFSYLLMFIVGMISLCLLLGICKNPAMWTPVPDTTTVGKPGHPSHAALAGLTVLAIYGQRRVMNWRTVAASWATGIIVGGIGLSVACGTLFGFPSMAFFAEHVSAAMSLPTAVAFMLLAAALVRCR